MHRPSWLKLIDHWRHQTRPRRRRQEPVSASWATVQVLEQRQLLSATAVGDEQLVNNITSGSQTLEYTSGNSIATSASGDTVVAWQTTRSDGSYDVMISRFAADGTPTGEAEVVNSSRLTSIGSPTVSMSPAGDYLVTWNRSRGRSGFGFGGWGSAGSDIVGQRFAADGSRVGGEFQVNTTTFWSRYSSSSTFLADGRVAVTWQGVGTGDYSGVFLRIFDSNGQALTGEVLVNQTVSGSQANPVITTDSNGHIAVAWHGSGTGRTQGTGVFTRRFDASGQALTNEVLLSRDGESLGSQMMPAIAAGPDGQILVTWHGAGPSDGQGIFGVLVGPNGQPASPEFRINQDTSGNQSFPTIATLSDGFVVAWQGPGEGDSLGVQMQQFDWNGNPVGDTQRVNQTTDQLQYSPSVSAWSAGIQVAWMGRGTGDTTGVFLRSYELPSSQNAAPQLDVPDQLTVNEGSLASFLAEATDADLPQDQLTFSLTGNVPDGAVLDPHTGQFSWQTTEADGNRELTIGVRVTDSLGASDEKQVRITVIDMNEAPVLAGLEDQDVLAGDLVTLQALATDVDLPTDELTYQLGEGAPAGAAIDSQTGEFTWQTGPADQGTVATITVIVTDGQGGTDQQTFSVTVRRIPAPPQLQPIDAQQVTEGQELRFTAQATDANLPDDHLTYQLGDGAPAGAQIDADSGEFRWTPTADQTPNVYVVTIRVTDDSGLSDTQTFQITTMTVNLPPELNLIGDRTANEGEPLQILISATDPDQPDSELRYDLVSGPSTATLDPDLGTFRWTPAAADGNTTVDVTVRVTDSRGGSDTQTFTIFVQRDNQAPVLTIDGDSTRTVQEGELLLVSAMATDANLPHDQLTFSLAPGAPTGAVIDANTGLLRWTPGELHGAGNFPITIRVTDQTGLSDSVSILVRVTETNQPPVLPPIANQRVSEGQQLEIALNASDADLPANELTYQLDSGPTGAWVNSVTGDFVWIPDESFGGTTANVTVSVHDGQGGSDSQSFTIQVDEQNSFPVLDLPGFFYTVSQGEELQIQATASDPDVPQQTLEFSLGPLAPEGATIDPQTGLFRWTPAVDQEPGDYVFAIDVSDGSFVSGTFIVVTVTVANRPPVLTEVSDQSVVAGQLLTVDINAADPDLPSQTLRYSLDPGHPPGAQIDPVSGVFHWTPALNQPAGSYPVTVRVTDSAGGTATTTFSIQVSLPNRAPVLQPIGNLTVNELELLSFTASATDPDLPDDQLTWSLDPGAPAGITIDPNTGLFEWTPTETQGPETYVVSVRVTDQGGLSDAEVILITVLEVSQPPVLSEIEDATINAGDLFTFTAEATDADLPTQQLRFSLDPGHPPGAQIDPGTGQFRFATEITLPPGPHSITVRVTDSEGASDTQTFELTVENTRHVPQLQAIDNQTVNEQELLSFTVSATDADLPDDQLTWTLDLGAPAGASIDPVTGQFAWTPGELPEEDSFDITVRVTDRDNLSDTQTFSVAVLKINQPPELTDIEDVSLIVGDLLSFTAEATDSDLPTQQLLFSLDPGHPVGATIDPDTGEFSWTPPLTHPAGNYSITVRVTDSEGVSDTATFNIALSNPFSPPQLPVVADIEVNELQPISIDMSAVDQDLPDDQLTYSLIAGAPAGATINPTTGLFEWTPSESQGPGDYTITVRVVDSVGFTDTETFRITVNEVNVPPQLQLPDVVDTPEGEQLILMVQATDADLPQQDLVFSLDLNRPAGTTINSRTGEFRWTPSELLGGTTHRIFVTVTDSAGAFDRQSFLVRVIEVNRPPVLQPIPTQGANPGVLWTLDPVFSDPDLPRNTLTLQLSGDVPAGMQIVDGQLRWTPPADMLPTRYNITLTVNDGEGGSASESFELAVLLASAPELELIGPHTIDELQPLSFQAAAQVPDDPNAPLVFSLIGPQGATIDADTGAFEWTPPGDAGPDVYQLTIRVTDLQNGLSDSETFDVAVGHQNQTPVLIPIGNRTVDEHRTLQFRAQVTDADQPAQTHTFSLGPNAPEGASIHASTGEFHWTPGEDLGGTVHTFEVRVTDEYGAHASEEITVTVNETNARPLLFRNENYSVVAGNLFELELEAIDSDTPGQELSFRLTTAPPGMTIIENMGQHRLSWTPRPEDTGFTHSALVSVEDPAGSFSLQFFGITVTAADGAVNRPIGPGETYGGQLDPNSEDQFTINAEAGEDLFVSVKGQHPTLAPRVTVEAPDGTVLLRTSLWPQGYPLVVRNLPEAGSYRIRVANEDTSEDQRYLITAVTSGAVATPEAQIALKNNQILDSGRTYDRYLQSADIDTYSFDAQQGDSFFASITDFSADSSFLPEVILYGPDGTEITTVTTAWGQQGAELSAENLSETGTYLVIVRDSLVSYTGNGNFDRLLSHGSYSFTGVVQGPGPHVNGIHLTSGHTQRSQLGLGAIDTYTVDASAGFPMHVSLGETDASESFSPVMFVYAPDGSLVDTVSSDRFRGDGGFSWSLANPAVTGRYTLVLQDDVDADSSDAPARGDYSITAVVAAPASWRHQTPLVSGQTWNGHLTTGDVDAFTIDLTAGSPLHLAFGEVEDNASFTPFVSIYDPNGVLLTSAATLQSATHGGNVSIHPGVPVTGRYTVVVQDVVDPGLPTPDQSAAGAYSLTIVAVDNPPIDPAANADSVALMSGQTQNDQLGVGDIDRFMIDVDAGSDIHIAFSKDSADPGFAPQLSLYGPDGTLIDSFPSAGSSGFTQLISRAPESGRYSLVLFDQLDIDQNDSLAVGDYSLTVVVANSVVDANSPVLTNGAMVGRSLNAGEIDTFVIDADAGSLLTLDLQIPVVNPESEAQVFVYSESGRLVEQFSLPTGGTVTTANPLPSTGRFTILVLDQLGNAVGDYELTATLT